MYQLAWISLYYSTCLVLRKAVGTNEPCQMKLKNNVSVARAGIKQCGALSKDKDKKEKENVTVNVQLLTNILEPSPYCSPLSHNGC